MGKEDGIKIGNATILVNVGGIAPLSLTGVIEKITTLRFNRHEPPILHFPEKVKIEGEVEVEGDIVEVEQFLIVEVTAATIPVGLPLSIAQLTAADVAINLDYVIMILPVEVA